MEIEEEERPVSEIIADYEDEDLNELVELIYRQNISFMNKIMIDMQLETIESCLFEMNKRSIYTTRLRDVEEKMLKKRNNEL